MIVSAKFSAARTMERWLRCVVQNRSNRRFILWLLLILAATSFGTVHVLANNTCDISQDECSPLAGKSSA